MKGDMKFSTVLALILAVGVLVVVGLSVFPVIYATITGTESSIKLGQYCTHWSINGYEGRTIETPTKSIDETTLNGLCAEALRHDVNTEEDWDECRCWCNKTCSG